MIQKIDGLDQSDTKLEAFIATPAAYAALLEVAVKALPGFTIPLDDMEAQAALRRALCARVSANLRALGVDPVTARLLTEITFTGVLADVIRFHRHAGHA